MREIGERREKGERERDEELLRGEVSRVGMGGSSEEVDGRGEFRYSEGKGTEDFGMVGGVGA